MLTNNSLTVTNITEHSSCDKFLELTFMVLNLTAGAITLCGNLLVFVVTVTSPSLYQHPMNQFLASLAVTDVIMGACISPGYSLFCLGCLEYSLSKYCWLLVGTKDIAFISSIYNLLAISYDRCVAVYWPLRYLTLMTRRRVILILCLTWGLSFAIAAIRQFWLHTKTGTELDDINSEYNTWVLAFLVLTPSIIVTVINVKIILTIRKQARQVIALRNAHSQDANEAEAESQAEVTRQRKGTIACALVVIVFFVCWVPRVIFNVQYKIKGDIAKVNASLQKVSVFFLIVQSSVNPFIYSFYKADFRQAVVKLLRCNRN